MWILLGVRKVPWLSGEAFYHSAAKLISQCYRPVFDLFIICTEKENVIQSFWNLIFSWPRTCCHVNFFLNVFYSGSGNWIDKMLSSKTAKWSAITYYSLLKNIKRILKLAVLEVRILRSNRHLYKNLCYYHSSEICSCWKIGQRWISQAPADTDKSFVLTPLSWNDSF